MLIKKFKTLTEAREAIEDLNAILPTDNFVYIIRKHYTNRRPIYSIHKVRKQTQEI